MDSYILRRQGKPWQVVEVLAIGGGRGARGQRRSPRSALVLLPDGTRVVRPFRGLRRSHR